MTEKKQKKINDRKKVQKSPQKNPKVSQSPRTRSITQTVATSPPQISQRSSLTPERVNSPELVNPEVAQRSQNLESNGGADLNEIYTNPALPSTYSGDIKKFILQKESISRHKRKLNIFKRRKVFVLGPWVAIQADTAFYISSGRKNDGYKYILGNFVVRI
jgi:hypothetical protein